MCRLTRPRSKVSEQRLISRRRSHQPIPVYKGGPASKRLSSTFGALLLCALVWAVAGPSSAADLICTAAELTARTVSDAVNRCVEASIKLDQLVVSGGGVHDAYLMRRLRELLPGLEVIPVDVLGIPADAKEAVGFAVLANETFELAAGNVPSATGARRPVFLGKATYGRNYGAPRGYS